MEKKPCGNSFEKLIRNGYLDFNYLDTIGFNPYWPHELKPPTDFTSAGLSDLEKLVNIIGSYSGIYSLRVVGSACVGLANAFPYGVKK